MAGLTIALLWRDRADSRERNSRERAHQMLRADLNSLALAETQYFFERARFSADLVSLQLILTPGNEIRFQRADSTGWSAVLTHTESHATCSAAADVVSPQPRDPVCQ